MTDYVVVTMGSGLVDAFVNCKAKERVDLLCFPLGAKIPVKEINFSTGGGATNTATCFSRLGLKVGFLGKIGSGYNAKIILRELKKERIDFLGVESKDHTGYSIILVGEKGHRTILTFKGASNNLKFSEIKLRRLRTKWLYFTSMQGESFLTQKKIARYAYKKGIKLAYNPSIQYTKYGMSYIHSILKHAHLVSLNKEEAQMLVKKGNLFKELSKMGPKIVSITDGEREGGVYDGNFLYRYWPHKIKFKETTGAGDAFGSSLLAGLVKLKEIDNAIRVAIANSESVIKIPGAKDGLLSWREIEKIINDRKFRIKKEVL
jgi:ribokinase